MEHVVVQCSHSPARVRCQVYIGDKHDRILSLELNQKINLLQSPNLGKSQPYACLCSSICREEEVSHRGSQAFTTEVNRASKGFSAFLRQEFALISDCHEL